MISGGIIHLTLDAPQVRTWRASSKLLQQTTSVANYFFSLLQAERWTFWLAQRVHKRAREMKIRMRRCITTCLYLH